MTDSIEKLHKSATICLKDMEINDMAKLFKSDIDSFKGILLVLTSLRDPALGDKQWDEIR